MALHYVIFFYLPPNANNTRTTKGFIKLNESSPQVHSVHFNILASVSDRIFSTTIGITLPCNVSPHHRSFEINAVPRVFKTDIVTYFVIDTFLVLIGIDAQTKVYRYRGTRLITVVLQTFYIIF